MEFTRQTVQGSTLSRCPRTCDLMHKASGTSSRLRTFTFKNPDSCQGFSTASLINRLNRSPASSTTSVNRRHR